MMYLRPVYIEAVDTKIQPIIFVNLEWYEFIIYYLYFKTHCS